MASSWNWVRRSRRLLRGRPLRRSLVDDLSAASLSSAYDDASPSFSELYNLPHVVARNMENQGLVYPTEIQKKSLESLLTDDGKRCTIINAETGSGKTLCFLLPVMKLFDHLWQKDGYIPAASAAVLVPSPHLAQQVSDVFRSLADPNWKTSLAAFHHTSFSFTKDSHLLIAVPGKLQNYDLHRLFANNRILCLDEADILLSGGENSVTKDILKLVQGRRSSKRSVLGASTGDGGATCSDTAHKSKVILTAATLPSRGPENVGKQVLRLFPPNSAVLIKTENTHKVLPMAELKFTRCKVAEDKFSQLIKDLDALSPTDCASKSDSELPKVLIFANTVKSATAVSNFLQQSRTISAEEPSPSVIWWHGRVGCFFKQPGVLTEQREQVLRDFRNGSVRVVVCSDLGSRGLDFPDCNAVIQFDFPENSEHFLHRAGRTARAGRSGKVISYVLELDEDVTEEIRKVIIDRRATFDKVFSRNKLLRRRINRKKGV